MWPRPSMRRRPRKHSFFTLHSMKTCEQPQLPLSSGLGACAERGLLHRCDCSILGYRGQCGLCASPLVLRSHALCDIPSDLKSSSEPFPLRIRGDQPSISQVIKSCCHGYMFKPQTSISSPSHKNFITFTRLLTH